MKKLQEFSQTCLKNFSDDWKKDDPTSEAARIGFAPITNGLHYHNKRYEQQDNEINQYTLA